MWQEGARPEGPIKRGAANAEAKESHGDNVCEWHNEDMHRESEERVRSLRVRASEATKAVAAMVAQFKHPYFQKQLQNIQSDLDELESFFLSSLDRQQITASEEAMYISSAEFVFREITMPKIKRMQDVLAGYGPNAIAIPYS